MRVFEGFDHLPHFVNPVVTVGSYDGVHRGHRELLRSITDLAKERGGESVVITFSPHPRQVLGDGSPVKLLNSSIEKQMLLEKIGIDNLIVAEFSSEFSKIGSYDFLRNYLIGKVGVATLVVGYNHHFGHNKEGDFDYLSNLQSEFGFDIRMVPRHEVESAKVSSTVIRHLIERGELGQAERYLGYPYFFVANIDEGIRLGDASKLLPPEGSYKVEVGVGEDAYLDTLTIASSGDMSLTKSYEEVAGGQIVVVFLRKYNITGGREIKICEME